MFVNEPLGYYRIHPEGNSQKDPLANFIENIKIMEIVLYEMSSLLSADEMNIVSSTLKHMRTLVFQYLANTNLSTVKILEYLLDKKF